MKNRLPVYIDNLELSINEDKNMDENTSYVYVNILCLLSLIITVGSVITIVILGK